MASVLRSSLLVIMVSVMAISFSIAQGSYKATRLPQESITLDGILDEPVWQQVEPLEYWMFQPDYGGEPTERSEMYFAYDDNYIYLAGEMYSDPALISDTGKERDLFKPNNDYFGIILDTFDDNENGLAFFTSPSGLRLDFAIFNDAQVAGQQPPINDSWNTFWDARSTKTNQGWFTEMRIPFSSLRFQDLSGDVTMGVIIWRWMASKSETHIWPLVRNDLGDMSPMKPSSGRSVVFENVYSQKPIYLAPYGLAGIQREMELNNQGDAYIDEIDPQLNAGFDLKYGLTNNLTLDITANPDFAQVEVDDQQINLTRFSLFFPEKRLFFQERSSIFRFDLGGPNTIFYSRRIGLDEGEIVPIYGGVRLNGRAGAWDLGFLDMQTASKDSIASTNYGVLRLRRNIINSQTYIGTMLVNKLDTEGNFNTALGLDGIFKVYKDHYMAVNFAQTYENDGLKTPFSMDHSNLRIQIERRATAGFGYDLSYNNLGPRYNPEMGFRIRENVTRFGNRIWWGWLPGEKSSLYTHSAYITGTSFNRNTDWTTESADIGVGWRFQAKNTWGGDFTMQHFIEDVADTFQIGDAEIPSGTYKFDGVTTVVNTPYSSALSFLMISYLGTFYDGRALTLIANPIWSPTPSLELGIRYEYNRGIFDDRNQGYEIHLTGMKAKLMFSNKLSMNLFVQYNTDIEEVFTNLRIRYNPREGNDLFIVYNDNLNTNRHREVPTIPLSTLRALLIKYTYTFTWVR